MADLPSRWPTEAPTERRALERWLLEREEELANAIASRLAALIVRTSNRYLDSLTQPLTASGDSAEFDEIPGEWQSIVASEITPAINSVYLSGSVNAYIGNPLADEIPELILDGWIGVVNTQAEDYLAVATNRIVGIGDEVWAVVRDKVSEAVATGGTTVEVAEEVQKLVDGGQARARTIARTEINSAYNNGRRLAADALGEYGPLEKVWIAVTDARTRDSHRLLDNVVIPWSEMFQAADGPLIAPGDPTGPASEVVNCRCNLGELYAGMARPDGSIVGTDDLDPSLRSTQRTDISDEAWVYDPWADWSG